MRDRGRLAWIVRDNVSEQQSRANVLMTMTQMREVERTISMYRLENREIPPTLGGIVPYLDAPAVPTDRLGHRFVYQPGDDGRATTWFSYGADGVPGGEGENADITRESLR